MNDTRQPTPNGIAVDPDGKRRVVLTRDDKRLIDRAAKVLLDRGLAVLIGCNPGRDPKDGPPPCGQVLRPADDESGRRVFECGCTRIHIDHGKQ